MLRRAGQPAVIGSLLSGLLLGPSLFGWLAPQWFHIVFPDDPDIKGLIKGIAEIGVMMGGKYLRVLRRFCPHEEFWITQAR